METRGISETWSMPIATVLGYIDGMRFPRLHRCPSVSVLLATVAIFASIALACPVTAQMACMPGMADTEPIPPPEQLPAPEKMSGIGNSHITIKANAEAQAWFDQGLSLLHDFWDYESAKAFEQA